MTSAGGLPPSHRRRRRAPALGARERPRPLLPPYAPPARAGEVLKALDAERYLVKSSHGPRYVVGVRRKVDQSALKPGTRVTLDVTTFTIMRALPREVDPTIYSMASEDPGKVPYSAVGGLAEQIRELREVIELPLTNPELFKRVGIKAPKGVLLYGPPGTGKTLLARALACNLNATFLKVVASAIVDKYIGESARVIREMFGYAKDHQPCVIFMDEVDAIGASSSCARLSTGSAPPPEPPPPSHPLTPHPHPRARAPTMTATRRQALGRGLLRRPRDPAHADGASVAAGRL